MESYSQDRPALISLFRDKDAWSTLPSCQREYVWDLRQQQGYIDSLLRGLPVTAIMYIETYVEFYGVRKELVDGQQRLLTIFRFFRDEFPTARAFSSEEVTPLYPGKRYSELPMDARSRFDNYKLPTVSISGLAQDSTIGLIFRRWQGGKTLTFAERLYSYDGITKDVADRVAGHRFWVDFYSGKTNRKQPFQAGIKLLILESLGTFANLTSPRQVDALTKQSNRGEIPDRMVKRLDVVMHLFDGSIMTSIGHVVLAYQAVMLLDQHGFALTSCPSGCLAPWFMRMREELQRDYYSAAFGTADLDKVTVQRALWAKEWDAVSNLAAAGKRDPRRAASMGDKIYLWNRQGGVCAVCGKELRFDDGLVAHHIVPYASGGPTKRENLMLVHKGCHDNAPIASMQSLWDSNPKT